MSMLSRYRKVGGFHHLVNLVETCDPTKKRRLLSLIATEDPGWAVLVRQKALSVARIFSWPETFLNEFIGQVPDRIMAIALHEGTPADIEKILKLLPHSKAREVGDLFRDLQPTPAEQHAAAVKLVLMVRDWEREGKIKLSTVDPGLEVNDKLVA
jgi:flagellar motor switch protein FliG